MPTTAQEASRQGASAQGTSAEGTDTRRDIVRAGEFEIETIVNRRAVAVAEPVVVKILVRGPAESEVRFASLGSRLGDWEIVSVEDEANLPLPDGRRISRRLLELEALLPEKYAIPTIAPEVWMRGERMDLPTLRSSAFDVRVLSVLDAEADPRQPRDIQPVLDVEVEATESSGMGGWVWGLAIAGATGVILVAVYVVRRKRAITPRQWALRELADLQPSHWDVRVRESGAPAGGASRFSGSVWASEMDGTLRSWIGMRTGIPATAMASEELVEALEASGVRDAKVGEALSELLGRWDRCRFAGEAIDSSERQQQWERARWVVERVEEVWGEMGNRRLTGTGGE